MLYVGDSCFAHKFIKNKSMQLASGLLGSSGLCLRDAMSQQVRHYAVKQEPSVNSCEAAGHSVLDQVLFQRLPVGAALRFQSSRSLLRETND